eukprot:5364910-Pleurochrysis_carterae.AAC.1
MRGGGKIGRGRAGESLFAGAASRGLKESPLCPRTRPRACTPENRQFCEKCHHCAKWHAALHSTGTSNRGSDPASTAFGRASGCMRTQGRELS